MKATLKNITTEYQNNLLGLDSSRPRFGWCIECAEKEVVQKAYQIVIREKQSVVWDSGKIEGQTAQDILYQGEPLQPCTRYQITVRCYLTGTDFIQGESWFETGLLNPSITAWDGAQWIGSTEHSLCARALSIFAIESDFCIKEGGSAAGIVFGANDPRLLEEHRNIYSLAGTNYISYEINVESVPAILSIYRVGYAPEDSEKIPFATTPLVVNGRDIITNESKHKLHNLRIEVYGNHARAFVDGLCVDEAEYSITDIGDLPVGRQLGPLGMSDVITFPRLHSIGFVAEAGTTAEFANLKVSNIRSPGATLLEETPEKNRLFSEYSSEENFVLQGEAEKKIIYKDPSYGGQPLLKKTVALRENATLSSARLYASARGIYQASINNAPLNNFYFMPNNAQFDKHIYYNTYDITDKLTQKQNDMTFQLATGWWADGQTYTLMNYNYYGDTLSLLAKIVLTYTDGSVETIVSQPEQWQCAGNGSVQYASYFQGERFDSRVQADDLLFLPCKLVTPVPLPVEEQVLNWPCPNHTEPAILADIGGPVQEIDRLQAISYTEVRPGVYIYDMGQNMVGVPRVKVSGAKGDCILLRYAEITYPDLPEYHKQKGLLMTENLREAENNDEYICSGNTEGEWYSPRFTLHGYRYLEISGVSHPPSLNEVEGLVLSSMVEQTGHFQCENPTINRLFDNIIWSQRSNFVSTPVDCSQRNERMGWLGDSQAFVRTSSYNSDVRLFNYRYLQAIRDLQSPEGQYPNIAPLGGGFGGLAWEAAGIIVPYEIHRQYNDTKVVRDNYQSMKKYMDYLEEHSENGRIKEGVGVLGDWLALDDATDNPLIWNAYVAYLARCMAYMAEGIGEQQDAEKYQNHFAYLQKIWNSHYVEQKTGKTKSQEGSINDTQTSYVLPLYFGLFSGEAEGIAAEHLNRKTIEVDYTLTTGFLGTGLICNVLTNYGYQETAVKLISQTKYPSWLYPITQGATTIWERWNSYTKEAGFGGNNNMNSFNHYSLGAVGAWLYAYILGISAKKNGYQEFVLAPALTAFREITGHYTSPYGTIKSQWSYPQQHECSYHFTVPANTVAHLTLPLSKVLCSDVPAICEGVLLTGESVQVLSGAYTVQLLLHE